MLIQRTLLAAALILPIGLLVSTGCGILTLPVEAPKVAIVNSKLIIVTADVADESGQPLDQVTADITARSIATNIFNPEYSENNKLPQQTFNKTFSYSSFGHYVVIVVFSKEGYQSATRVYSLSDDPVERELGSWKEGSAYEFPPESRVNTTKNPHSVVVLQRLPTPAP